MWGFARAVESHLKESAYDLVFGLGKTWSHDVIRLGGGCHATYLERTAAPTRFKDRLALRIEARALAEGAYRKVITNSQMVRDDVIKRHGVPGHALEVIYNGVDLERFHPALRQDRGMRLRREADVTPDQPVVLFLGTGYERKGLDRALAAFHWVHSKDKATRLLIAGHASNQAEWEARARQLGLADEVRFLGKRSDPEACFAAADAYLLPTRYDPFANSTLEALACGVPVVTTPDNGASELLTSGDAGSVIANSDDAQALGSAVSQWLAKEPGSTGARSLAEANSASRMAQRTIEVLEALT